jgi:malonate decarboxylase beta subunit
MIRTRRQSFYDATARDRVGHLFDSGSFREFLPPTLKRVSPHLGHFNVPVSFDDGVVIGEAKLDGKGVLVFAQEGRFLGGALGEVHASKIVGLLRRAARDKPAAVVGLLDSGGVRLQEANVGEIGASEIIRAAFEARAAGVRVIGLIGGVCGCFGGMGIISCCLDALIASEHARIGVSGPEVIETNVGVQEFDSRDKALVWRTTGAKNRLLFGMVRRLVEDHIPDFRAALIAVVAEPAQAVGGEIGPLESRLAVLRQRLTSFGQMRDAYSIWKAMGIADPAGVPEMDAATATALKASIGGSP